MRWRDTEGAHTGFCLDLFPWGGACHGMDEQRTYRHLAEWVREGSGATGRLGKELPVPATRPMPEATGI